MENNDELFKGTLDELNKLSPEVVVISVKSWRNTDKYECPKCGTKVGMPTYTCTDCNVKIKPVMNF